MLATVLLMKDQQENWTEKPEDQLPPGAGQESHFGSASEGNSAKRELSFLISLDFFWSSVIINRLFMVEWKGKVGLKGPHFPAS